MYLSCAMQDIAACFPSALGRRTQNTTLFFGVTQPKSLLTVGCALTFSLVCLPMSDITELLAHDRIKELLSHHMMWIICC